MTIGKQPHILNASSNLIGICFILITGLKITGKSDTTWADELSLVAAFVFLGSCLLSYISLRSATQTAFYEKIADLFFLIGILILFVAVTAFSFNLF